MKCSFLSVSIFSVLLVYSEADCWQRTGNGTDCEYDGIIIAMGTKYEDTTGPVCYKCSCSNTGKLDCCHTSRIIRGLPDTCKIVQEGCHQVAVSRADESQPCEGPIGGVLG